MSDNMFRSAQTPEQLIYQVVGAAATCWQNPAGAGVFELTRAQQVAAQALRRLDELTDQEEVR